MTIMEVMQFLQKFDPADELVAQSYEWEEETGHGSGSYIQIFDDVYGKQTLEWEEFEPYDDED